MADDRFRVKGWEIGFSRDVLIAALERGDGGDTGLDFDVAMAQDAEEAAYFLREKENPLISCWKGSKEDLDFIIAFMTRYTKIR